MNRTEVLQHILDRKPAPTYLEIGVYQGDNFFPLRARRKIAVDPDFRFSLVRRAQWMFKNRSNLSARYHSLDSDRYFTRKELLRPVDVVFVDGLHTSAQALKDVENSLSILKHDGVIVLHDCDPPHAAAAWPAQSLSHARSLNLPGWTGAWCGDVWKTVCRLRSTRSDLRVFVLDCDCGLGIVTRGQPDHPLALQEYEIAAMTYDDLVRHRRELLNLKDESYLSEFVLTL